MEGRTASGTHMLGFLDSVPGAEGVDGKKQTCTVLRSCWQRPNTLPNAAVDCNAQAGVVGARPACNPSAVPCPRLSIAPCAPCRDLWQSLPGAAPHLRRCRNTTEVRYLACDLRRRLGGDMDEFRRFLEDGERAPEGGRGGGGRRSAAASVYVIHVGYMIFT
jgi:hypothetical protein